jgi:NAD(P)H-nitrite reductase large subunit
MHLDDHVCLCFRVTRRKLINFVRRECPTVPSQLSQCGGAGTGCGWCVPFLRQIFNQGMAEASDLDTLSAAEYAARRARHVRTARGVPGGADPPEAAEDTTP